MTATKSSESNTDLDEEPQLTERMADEFASLFLYWAKCDREARERADAEAKGTSATVAEVATEPGAPIEDPQS